MPHESARPLSSASSLVAQGLHAHRAGRIADAEAHYRAALAAAPEDLDALHLLGVCRSQRGDASEAIAHLEHALRIQPGSAPVIANLGNALQDAGRFEEALASFERALAMLPSNAELLMNRGNVLVCLGRLAEAERSLRAALALAPSHPLAWLNLARCLRAAGKLPQALAAFEQSEALAPLGVAVLFERGLLLLDLELANAALRDFERALDLGAGEAATRTHRAVALGELGRHDEALADLRRVARLEASSAAAHNNLGIALYRVGNLREALEAFGEALRLEPRFAKSLASRGLVLADLGRQDAALADFDAALAIAPDDAFARLNRGLCRLRRGDFAAGWPDFEARWRDPAARLIHAYVPSRLWLGEGEIQGRQLELHAEQGLGDTVQFCRYARCVADRGARVRLVVQPEALELVRSLVGFDGEVAASHGSAYDLHTPLLSLPLAIGTCLESIPGQAPYLSAAPARVAHWNARLGPRRARRRVGLAWSGRAAHVNDRHRSLALAVLRPVLEVDADWISLQFAVRDADRPALAGSALRSFEGELRDLADTAALIACLDLVVSVDTAVAHVAGALGTPVWILLPFNPDWRWLLDRDDSPWYPSARLFRQDVPGNWRAVAERAAHELRGLAASP